MAAARDFKFCTLVRQVAVYHWDYKPSLKGAWSRSRDVFKFSEISDKYLGNGARQRHSYNERQIGNHIWAIKWYECQ